MRRIEKTIHILRAMEEFGCRDIKKFNAELLEEFKAGRIPLEVMLDYLRVTQDDVYARLADTFDGE